MNEIDKWNKCIEYLSSNTRFSLSDEFPDGFIRNEDIKRIGAMLKFKPAGKNLPWYDTSSYMHDGEKIISACDNARTVDVVNFILEFMRECTGDKQEQVKTVVVESYKKHHPNVDINFDSWRSLFTRVSNKEKAEILLIVYDNILDKSKIPYPNHGEIADQIRKTSEK